MRARTNNRQKGQSLVEFAISLPLMLLLGVAAFDVGMAVANYHRLVAAAREGARVATESTNFGNPNMTAVQISDAEVQVSQSAIARTQLALTQSGINWWDSKVTVEAGFRDVSLGNVQYRFLEIETRFQPDFILAPVFNLFDSPDNPFIMTASATAYVTEKTVLP